MSNLIPLYRLQGHGDHFYTTSAEERDNAIAQYGYTSEGVACYVSATDAGDTTAMRDDFAAHAMMAIVGCAYLTGAFPEAHAAAASAYRYADAMLVARAK